MSDNCNTHKSVGVGPGSRSGPTVYNKIKVTPSGHRFEVDDSAGNERIRRQHTTGTYEEFDATGGRTVEVVGENFTACCSGNTVVVNGVCDITVVGNCNLRVDQTQDPETGNLVDGNLKVEAENIYLNSRKNMELNAGGHLSLETRQPKGNEDSEEKAPGGDIGIVSAGDYKLKVKGEAKERFKKSLDTNIDHAFDLTIGRDCDVHISGDFKQRATGQTTLSAGEKLKLVSEDKTIISSNNDVKIKSTDKTQFDSAQFKIASGPVNIVEAITADSTIDAAKEITGPRDVKLSQHKHTGDGRSDPAASTTIPL